MIVNVHAAKTNLSKLIEWAEQDPFDRLLVSQAISERLSIVTRDRAMSRYGVKVFNLDLSDLSRDLGRDGFKVRHIGHLSPPCRPSSAPFQRGRMWT